MPEKIAPSVIANMLTEMVLEQVQFVGINPVTLVDLANLAPTVGTHSSSREVALALLAAFLETGVDMEIESGERSEEN